MIFQTLFMYLSFLIVLLSIIIIRKRNQAKARITSEKAQKGIICGVRYNGLSASAPFASLRIFENSIQVNILGRTALYKDLSNLVSTEKKKGLFDLGLELRFDSGEKIIIWTKYSYSLFDLLMEIEHT